MRRMSNCRSPSQLVHQSYHQSYPTINYIVSNPGNAQIAFCRLQQVRFRLRNPLFLYNADFSSPAGRSGVPGLVVVALAVVLAAPPG